MLPENSQCLFDRDCDSGMKCVTQMGSVRVCVPNIDASFFACNSYSKTNNK